MNQHTFRAREPFKFKTFQSFALRPRVLLVVSLLALADKLISRKGIRVYLSQAVNELLSSTWPVLWCVPSLAGSSGRARIPCYSYERGLLLA